MRIRYGWELALPHCSLLRLLHLVQLTRGC